MFLFDLCGKEVRLQCGPTSLEGLVFSAVLGLEMEDTPHDLICFSHNFLCKIPSIIGSLQPSLSCLLIYFHIDLTNIFATQKLA